LKGYLERVFFIEFKIDRLFQVLQVDEDLVFEMVALSLGETLEQKVRVHVHELALGGSFSVLHDRVGLNVESQGDIVKRQLADIIAHGLVGDIEELQSVLSSC